ncbi:hypothetical protein B0H67DRAFT_588974 [Lasiosphaeris hirsuta]|uniref:Uncharacterized protein n=1 Tax=Lasiosphaeris hirsuta TaxID=260670 RepID=A0AA40A277_9PEZI|nr:hypothetical protein B0H67DRAFT_588974 [Lasiosphaeris hirsuta]
MPEGETYPVTQLLNLSARAWDKLGTDFHIAPKLGAVLKDAGFVSIECYAYLVPVGAWPSDR